MIKFIQYNLIALSSVFLARSLIIPMDHFNSNLGNTLWLPMGAVLLAFLLFGFRVFPGLLLGYLLAEIFIEGGTSNIGKISTFAFLEIRTWIIIFFSSTQIVSSESS